MDVESAALESLGDVGSLDLRLGLVLGGGSESFVDFAWSGGGGDCDEASGIGNRWPRSNCTLDGVSSTGLRLMYDESAMQVGAPNRSSSVTREDCH